jgi:hypothetical protein
MTATVLPFVPNKDGVDDPIARFIKRVYHIESPSLYGHLRHNQARIQRWIGELLLVSYDTPDNLKGESALQIESRGFSLGVLCDTKLVFEGEDVYFPTGRYHVSEKNYHQEKVWLENINIPVPRAFHNLATDPRESEVVIGNHAVQKWFEDHDRSLTLFAHCYKELGRALGGLKTPLPAKSK